MQWLNGERLRRLRVARGWSHGDLAQRLRDGGVKARPALVDKWERGGEKVNPNVLTTLAEIFQVELQAFRAPAAPAKKRQRRRPGAGPDRT